MLQVEEHLSRPEELRGWRGSPRRRARQCAEPRRAPKPSAAPHLRPQPPRHGSPLCGGGGQLSARHRKPPLERHRPRSIHSTSAAHQPPPSPCTHSIHSRVLPPSHGEQRCTGGARSRRPAGWLPVGGKDGPGGRRAIRMSPCLHARTRPGIWGHTCSRKHSRALAGRVDAGRGRCLATGDPAGRAGRGVLAAARMPGGALDLGGRCSPSLWTCFLFRGSARLALRGSPCQNEGK